MHDLITALEHYLETKREHDEAREKYHGCSWDYFGQPWRADMNKAARDFYLELSQTIQTCVDRRLDELRKEQSREQD